MNFNYSLYNKPKNTPNSNGHIGADVVCTFNKEGNIRPDYFRFSLPDESLATYKIENVLSVKELPTTNDYVCEYRENNRLHRIILTYWIRETRWTIHK